VHVLTNTPSGGTFRNEPVISYLSVLDIKEGAVISTLQDIEPGQALRAASGLIISFDGQTQYLVGQDWRIPQSGGIYFIHDLRGTIYIGRTNSLHRRFTEHYWNSHNVLLSMAIKNPVGTLWFSWMLVNGWTQVASEQLLIRAFRPMCNNKSKEVKK